MSTPVQRGIASGLNQALIHLFILSVGRVYSIGSYSCFRFISAM
ncbi:hypothetical protein [Candidatus Comchoanobacter bicostacola]|nr:hypothetical protein [Candidatus Comchoanobacter bicostacola]